MPRKTFPTGNRKTAPKRRRAPRKRVGPLAAWLNDNKVTLTAFASSVGASVQHVSNIVHGHGDPSLALALTIERATGGAVPVTSWS